MTSLFPPPRPPAVDLAVGDEVACVVCNDETGDKGRRNILGVARARVVAVRAERVDVLIEHGCERTRAYNGSTREARRCDVYAMKSKAERQAFEADVRFIWQRRA